MAHNRLNERCRRCKTLLDLTIERRNGRRFEILSCSWCNGTSKVRIVGRLRSMGGTGVGGTRVLHALRTKMRGGNRDHDIASDKRRRTT